MNERLRHRLEIQAAEIEAALARQAVQAHVEGGKAGQQSISFVVSGFEPIDTRTWNELRADLEDSLGAPWITLVMQDQKLQITVGIAATLDLLEILEHKLSLPAGVAALGWSTEDRPLLLNLNDPATGHVLFLGGHAAGKTAILRTAAVSLALSSRQSQVQMLFIDPESAEPEASPGPGLSALHYLPHALAAVVTQQEDIAEVLTFLADEMKYRRSHAVCIPRIVVFIDNLATLLDDGAASVRRALKSLLADGSYSGIHLIMATQPARPDDKDDLAELLALKPALRVVGKVRDSKEAQETTLLPASGAENLMARGDFLILAEDQAIRFQSAYVDAYDLHWCLETLQRKRPPTLLARPTSAQARPVSANGDEAAGLVFSYDGRRIEVEEAVGQ